MAARKLGSSSRRLTIEERINIAEGEDELSDSEDGLDIMGKRNGTGEVSFDEYLNALEPKPSEMVEISSDEDSSGPNKRKRTAYQERKGERVAFDEDEDSDEAYKIFKKRKGDKRKKAIASTKRAKAKVAGSSLVGKRQTTLGPLKENKEKNYGDPSDDEKDLMEETLSDYLQKRQAAWEQRKEKLGEMGLRIPPEYDDVEFSDDERLEYLVERPKLPSSIKQGKYEDIDMPQSAGRIPSAIAQYLRHYQLEGAEFLHKLFVWQEGGILGDDMGLGKTIQVIAFLTAAFGKTGDERDRKRMRKMRRMGDNRWYPRVLIICPGSLMSNWRSELERWGWWHIQTYHGAGTKLMGKTLPLSKTSTNLFTFLCRKDRRSCCSEDRKA
jgi:DNA excision repair protein ERCC-6-like 2